MLRLYLVKIWGMDGVVVKFYVRTVNAIEATDKAITLYRTIQENRKLDPNFYNTDAKWIDYDAVWID